MGICINFEWNWLGITLRYMENNTVALRIFEEYILNATCLKTTRNNDKTLCSSISVKVLE